MRFCIKNSNLERGSMLKIQTERIPTVERISDFLHGVTESEPKQYSCSKQDRAIAGHWAFI